MLRQILNSARMIAILTIACGVAYPMLITGLAQTMFPVQANGSILVRNQVPIGSKLLGQKFSTAGYFHGRPSAAGESGYDATSSGGSNLGPTSKKLIASATDNLKQVREDHGLREMALVPADLVLASGSGLDPDISLAAAYLQVGRIAGARNLPSADVRGLIDGHSQGRQWGLLGEPRVNVLELNLALDALGR